MIEKLGERLVQPLLVVERAQQLPADARRFLVDRGSAKPIFPVLLQLRGGGCDQPRFERRVPDHQLAKDVGADPHQFDVIERSAGGGAPIGVDARRGELAQLR